MGKKYKAKRIAVGIVVLEVARWDQGLERGSKGKSR